MVEQQIAIRRDTTANWAAVNPVLEDGEPAYDKNTGELRVGDGTRNYLALPSISGGGGGGGSIVPVVTGAEVRPSGAVVIWMGGSEQPVNMGASDIWFAAVNLTGDITPPTVPTGLVASGLAPTGFSLGWTASASSGGGVSLYDVQINGISAVTAVTNSASISGLTSGVTYSVQVRARDAAGNWSELSDPLSVTTTVSSDAVAPSVPASVVISAITSGGFTVSWAASTDAVGVTGYDVQVNGVSKGTPTATTLAVTGLSPSTAYAVRVRARDAAGNWSALSTVVNTNTLAGAVVTGHSVFPSSPSQTFTKYNDGGTIRVATGFYTYGSTAGWKAKGMRIFLPAGAAIPGANCYLWTPTLGQAPNLGAPAQTAVMGALSAGWNSIAFPTPVEMTPGTPVWVGYQATDGSYVHVATAVGNPFIAASDGSSLVCMDDGALYGGSPKDRSYYSVNGGATSAAPNAPIYGVDIIVSET